MPKAKDLTAPIALLALASLDLLPEVAQVLADREALSAQLENIESQVHETGRQITFYGTVAETAPSIYGPMIADARAVKTRLETQQKQLRDQTVALDQAVLDARVQTRRDILPELRRLGLPAIDARIAQLEAIAMVQRLLGAKGQKAHTIRQQHVEELAYMKRLRDLLLCEEQ
jgi:hypothetical protein